MSETNHKGERIAKRIARSGICSRRDAERLIEDRKVAVNGQIIESPALNVTEIDIITVAGKPLKGKEEIRTRLFLYHKPPGLLTTHRDDRGRPTVFEKMPKELPRVVSVGRLDMNTEGLLLLTTDGALSRYLELPSTGWRRKYRVRVNGEVDKQALEALQKGITIEGIHYKPVEAVLDKEGTNSWLTITIREGKNREIRKIMEHLGLKVNRLIRISFGPFNLGLLPRGAIEEVKPHIMKEQIKGFFKP